MRTVPLVKCINGHTGCAAAERYLEKGGRAIGHDFINLDCMEREDGTIAGWAAEMDELRALYGNGEPYRGKPAVTYRHYIVSPDPADKIDLERLRELACAWAEEHFGEYQLAIVYHDDNENRIPHAHIVVNNTNVETGRRLHVPDPKGLNRDLQQMARERGLGYLTDRPSVFCKHAKGGQARTGQREFKGRAERRIEREGGYSWVADIRERVKTARALACDEEGFRNLLGVLGVELSLNSPNVRRRDYLYALSDHPARKVSGEKLGRQYGKQALEFEWACGPPFEEGKLAEILEHAILVRDLEELGEMARAMGTIKDFGFVAIDSIDRAIAQLEHLAGDPGGRRGAADATEMLERVRHARRFAAEFGVLPVREPMSVFVGRGERSSTTWGDSSSYSHDASSQEHHIDHDRGDYAR